MSTPQSSSLAVRNADTSLDVTDPRVVAAATGLRFKRPQSLVVRIQAELQSQISRDLYLNLEMGEVGIPPREFREIMFVFLGREPIPTDLTVIPDPRYRHVHTSGADRVLDYLQEVVSVISDAHEGGIEITHLQAAWLVIQFGEHAIMKLDELINLHGTSKILRDEMVKHMRATTNFSELV